MAVNQQNQPKGLPYSALIDCHFLARCGNAPSAWRRKAAYSGGSAQTRGLNAPFAESARLEAAIRADLRGLAFQLAGVQSLESSYPPVYG